IGREGHSAYPETGASAVFRAARFLERLERLAVGALRGDADPNFAPPFTTVNVGLISGGRAKNVIPGSCKFTLEWRPIPSQPTNRVLELLEEIRLDLIDNEPGYEVKIKPLRMDRGVETAESSEVVQFIVAESGKKPETVAFGTEAPQLTQLGAE